MITYINKKSSNGEDGIEKRVEDKITNMAIFSHGDIVDFGRIMLDYSSSGASKIVLSKNGITKIAAESFQVNSMIEIYACNIGTKLENSTAQALANITNGLVTAYHGKTEYRYTVARPTGFLEKGKGKMQHIWTKLIVAEKNRPKLQITTYGDLSMPKPGEKLDGTPAEKIEFKSNIGRSF